MEQVIEKNILRKLAVFDIDGTITAEGRDSWLEATYKMVANRSDFESHLKIWKENKKEDPYGASLKMMKQAVQLVSKEYSNPLAVYQVGREIFTEYIKENQIRPEAIKTINRHYQKGLQIVFSTTSYLEVAKSLVNVLLESGLLKSNLANSIVVSGTEVDWLVREVNHFNMSQGKIEGIGKWLGMNTKEVRSNIEFAYGDDPLGNDSGILKHAENSFIVHTLKNSNFETTHIGERITW